MTNKNISCGILSSVSVLFDPASYEKMSDGELMRVAMDRDELMPEALAPLDAQLAARGLKQKDVSEFGERYRAEVAADQPPSGISWRNWGSHPFGTAFHGKRDLKEMQNREQYQATKWFTAFFIPLIPLGTFIVHRTTTTWLGLFDDVRTLRKVPLDWEQVFKTWAVAAVAVAAVYFLGYKLLWTWWVTH